MQKYKTISGKRFVRRWVLHFRPFFWFFRRGWYGFRWGVDGAFPGEQLYLIDIGMITCGWSYIDPDIHD